MVKCAENDPRNSNFGSRSGQGVDGESSDDEEGESDFCDVMTRSLVRKNRERRHQA